MYFLLCLVLSTVTISAQVTGGAITGSVVDPAGAVVPNATVRITDKARGQVLTAQTTDAGSYLFPNVPVGNYTVEIEAAGFAKLTREANVSLNQTTTLDISLQVSGSTTTVDVIADGGEAVVQTDNSQLGKSFDIRKVQDLPINGNPNNLAILAPNVVLPANGTAGTGGVSGGIRARGNSFNIDGVDNNDPSVTGPSTAPIQDAVEEFTLLQNNFNAEFGAGAGGQFNTITRSGTNQFRGNVFSYVQSQRFNARGTDEDGTEKNFLKDVRYGGTFGGYVPFIPNFRNEGPMFVSGKNKLFFFVAYEKYYNEAAGSSGTYAAPTLAGLNQIATIPGVSPFVVNLLRNNLTLASTATAQETADFGTILGRTGIPFGLVTLPIPASQQSKSYQFNFDHLPTDKNQFRYRYNRYRYAAEQAGSGGLQFNNNVVYNTDLFSFNWIRTISSSLVNDLRLSYRGATEDYPLLNPDFANFANYSVVELNLGLGPNGNLPQNSRDDSYQVYDSLTWITGQHTFKFGGDYRRALTSSNFLPRQRGDYSYTTFADFLQDLKPDDVNIKGIGSGAFVSNNHRIFAFGQDDWKIRPNLTLNLGLRYEYQGNYRDLAVQTTASPANVAGVIEFNEPQVDKNNFAPRVGFAWAPHFDNTLGRFFFGNQGQSSIRGNYARAYFSNFSNLTSISLPPTLQGELNGAGSATNFLANGAAGTAVFVPSTNPATLRALAGSFILDQIIPYSDSFAVSYQRELGKSMGLEVRYLKTYGRELPVQVQLNARQVPNAAFVIPTLLSAPTAAQLSGLPSITTIVANNPTIDATTLLGTRPLAQYGFAGALTGFPNIGESEYDGLSASLTKRFTRNFGFTAAYTFSRTLDNSTNELNTSALNPRRPQDAGNFFSPQGLNLDTEKGRSPLDIPHRFVTSFNVDIPFFNNSENGFLKTVLGGFQVNGIFQIQSGQPITVLAGRDANRNGDAAGDRAIFNPNGDPNVSSGIQAVALVNGVVTNVAIGDTRTVAYVALNPNAGFISTGFFAKELANQGAGTAQRNSVRTKPYNNTDLVILKNTRFGTDGRFNFQIGAEIFDLFNQRQQTLISNSDPQLRGFDPQTPAFATAGNANFLNYGLGVFPGRSITLRAKFYF